MDGKCGLGPPDKKCEEGDPEDNSNGRLWRCKGANGGTTTKWCPLDGECGPPGKCKKGRPDTQSANEWRCEGINGGSDAECKPGDCYPACEGHELCRSGSCVDFGACGSACIGRFCANDGCTTPYNCHVKDTGDGVCRPSCGYAAVIIGRQYGGHGPGQSAGNNPILTDDPHAYVNGPCDFLNTGSLGAAYASPDFGPFRNIGSGYQQKNIPIPWEIIEYGGGSCCIRDRTP